MNFVTGDMLWTNVNKIPSKYPYLSENIECDCLIIGGGISGAIASYYCSKANIDTVLVDKNIIGYGSTSASTSILQYEIDTDLIGLQGLIGEKKAIECFKLTEKAVFDIKDMVDDLDDNCDFSLTECFYYTNNSSFVNYMNREYNIRKNNGFDVELLDEKVAKEKFSFDVKAGIYSKKGAGRVDPYRMTHALVEKSLERGAKVYENTEVIDIKPCENYVILKTRNNFNIKAKKVIIATGYEGRKLVNKKLAILSRTFTVVTKPVSSFDGWHNKCIIRDNENPYTYLRTTGDNRIIIGGEDEMVGSEDSKMSNLKDDDSVSKMKYDKLIQRLKAYFPNIKDIDIEYCFSGIFGETKDGLPYIGEYTKLPNCYFSLGYGSNGIVYAIIAGQLLRDLCLNKKRKELNLFSLDR